MDCSNIKDLKLDEAGKIGYTYKSMGTGFWALKQDKFREAITKIVMQVSVGGGEYIQVYGDRVLGTQARQIQGGHHQNRHAGKC